MLAVALTVCLLPHFAALAKEYESPRTIRVGFFAFEGYHMIDEDGNRSGYGYEILQHMSSHANWVYEYVGYDKNWSQMLDMLENGEIDLLSSAQKTEERLERFDFCDEPLGYSATIVTARAGDTDYLYGDYENWNGIRVGMLEDNSRNDSFSRFAAENGFSYTGVIYNSQSELAEALQVGTDIDVIVSSNLRAIDNEWILAEFDTSLFYIMVRKGNTQLLDEINEVLELTVASEPGIRTAIWNKYYSASEGGEVSFTADEREYIQSKRETVFTAAINPDRAPLSYYSNGELRGIIPQIADEIIARSGLNIQIIVTKTRQEYDALVQSSEVDILLDFRYDFSWAEDNNFKLTRSYLSETVSRLTREDVDSIDTAAVISGSDIADKYARTLSERYSVVYYDSVDELVQAVISGEVDSGYLYTRVAELAINQDVRNCLAAETIYSYDMDFAIAVANKYNNLLLSVLDRSIASISNNDIADIVEENTDYTGQTVSLVRYIYRNPLFLVVILAIVFAAILLAILLGISRNRRQREAAHTREIERKNEMLAESLSETERANAAKSQFLSRVSHEMRTPLNAIIGFMTLARDTGEDAPATQKYIDNSQIAAKQLLGIINNVLDVSAIESGKLKIAYDSFNFKHMIDSIDAIYRDLCKQKGIEFETRLMTAVDEVFIGDQLRINQILINLLGNALKFTDKGHIWLSIGQRKAHEQVFIHFEIADTGCGMSEDLLTRLFRPFEQESAATAQRYGGSGLGLSIVKNLVTIMNGAIEVTSVQGEGTTFRLDIPLTPCAADKKPHLYDAENLRVLIVDDEESQRDYIASLFERIHVNHTCVSSGEAAIAGIDSAFRQGHPYRMCIVDWNMPEMNGTEVTRKIREKFGREMIVIVVSAYDQNRIEPTAKEAGADMFIAKPIFQSALVDLLTSLAGNSIAETSAHGLSQMELTGRKVLLVEDNHMNRIVAAGMLKKLGVICDEAFDGRQAVERFCECEPSTYDAILMDIQMPVMDGMEATRKIRASSHPEATTIPIIAVTANALTDDVAKILACGMNAHIAKPLSIVELGRTLSKAIL
ncbi:MAG: response regulator [Clostridia bacterium]|nr:response regulator [Clostridia bacterium]